MADDAIAPLRRAVTSDMDQSIYRVAIGAVAGENARYEEAAKAMQKAYELAPELVNEEIQTCH